MVDTKLVSSVLFIFIFAGQSVSFPQQADYDQPNNKSRGTNALLFASSGVALKTNVAYDRFNTIEDYLQYAAIFSVYGLNAVGIKGKNTFLNRTLILAGSGLLMVPAVYTLKELTRVKRPDGSDYNAFPSGHAAFAFLGAEMLRREFQDHSKWIGIAGYGVGMATGFYRLHHERHRLFEVIVGAGIGILSVSIASSVVDNFVISNSNTNNQAGDFSWNIIPWIDHTASGGLSIQAIF